MKNLCFKFFILNFLLLASYLAFSLELKTNVSSSVVSVGDVFTITVAAITEGGERIEVSAPNKPQHPLMSFLRESTGYSYQTTIINGQMSAKRVSNYNLTYYAKKAGEVNLRSFNVLLNNKEAKAPGIKIKIVASGGASQNQPQSNDPFGGMENAFKDFLGGIDVFGNRQDSSSLNFFVDLETTNMNPFYGEQFVASWYLYTNGRVTDIDSLKYPSLEGFWKEEISLATSLRGEDVERNGIAYTRYLLASYAITPIVNEQAFIDPYEVKCQLMGKIFSFGTKEIIRKSDEALIRIKPLPEENKPDSFTGAVGNYTLANYTENQVFKTGEPFTYVIRVQGEGQLKFMELPELDFDKENFEIYDTSEVVDFKAPLTTVKTYKLLIVPKKVGAIEVPRLKLGFFRPETAEYYEIDSKNEIINVQKGEAYSEDIVSIFEQDKEQRYVPQLFENINLKPAQFNISGQVYLGLAAVSFIICLLFHIFKFNSLQLSYDFKKDLKRRFSDLEKIIEAGKWREASTEAVNIVYFFANSQSKRKPKGQQLSDILQVLPSGLRRNVEVSLKDLNDYLQKYSFAPEGLVKKDDAKAVVSEKTLALKALLEGSLEDDSEKKQKD